eukprot:g20340.t1
MVVWSVIGSTVSFLIAFIMPALFWYKVVGPTVRPWRRRCSLVLALCCSVPWLPRRTQAARLVGHSVSEFGASAQTHWMEISF